MFSFLFLTRHTGRGGTVRNARGGIRVIPTSIREPGSAGAVGVSLPSWSSWREVQGARARPPQETVEKLGVRCRGDGPRDRQATASEGKAVRGTPDYEVPPRAALEPGILERPLPSCCHWQRRPAPKVSVARKGGTSGFWELMRMRWLVCQPALPVA